MSLQHLFKSYMRNVRPDLRQFCSAKSHNSLNASDAVLEEVRKASKKDLPVVMKNPFEKEKPQCILCKYKIDANYKNVRLLSQFVSKYTGRVYGRHITGLCEHQQTKVEQEIAKSRRVGLMGVYTRHPNFLTDPDLYDISKPFRLL